MRRGHRVPGIDLGAHGLHRGLEVELRGGVLCGHRAESPCRGHKPGLPGVAHHARVGDLDQPADPPAERLRVLPRPPGRVLGRRQPRGAVYRAVRPQLPVRAGHGDHVRAGQLRHEVAEGREVPDGHGEAGPGEVTGHLLPDLAVLEHRLHVDRLALQLLDRLAESLDHAADPGGPPGEQVHGPVPVRVARQHRGPDDRDLGLDLEGGLAPDGNDRLWHAALRSVWAPARRLRPRPDARRAWSPGRRASGPATGARPRAPRRRAPAGRYPTLAGARSPRSARPSSGAPVRSIAFPSMCAASTGASSASRPVRMFTTPPGTSEVASTSASVTAGSGAGSLATTTAVLPVAITGA